MFSCIDVKKKFKKQKIYIILIHIQVKSILKNNMYHTLKQALTLQEII